MTDETPPTVAELLAQIDDSWQTFMTYIRTLTPDQLTVPTDAAGWTVKDHLSHLAAWDDSMYALLEGLSRGDFLGVDKAIWENYDYDEINEIIRQQHIHKTVAETFDLLTSSHQRLVARIAQLQDYDLARPYNSFQPDSDETRPVFLWFGGNTYEHYEEHTPWIEAIVATKS